MNYKVAEWKCERGTLMNVVNTRHVQREGTGGLRRHSIASHHTALENTTANQIYACIIYLMNLQVKSQQASRLTP